MQDPEQFAAFEQNDNYCFSKTLPLSQQGAETRCSHCALL